MNYFDYYQVITLIVFLIVFFGRTIWLRIKGTKVFVIGSGKKGSAALLEKSFLVFFPIWLIEIGVHSLHLNIQLLPLVMVKLIFKNQIIQFFLMCFVCIALGFQFQIRQEETFLIERYGDTYRKYMALVNRYI
jgi:protein-S-isoprenylcysteine O-methyltransferase Ste14